jgi:hypothetical protein
MADLTLVPPSPPPPPTNGSALAPLSPPPSKPERIRLTKRDTSVVALHLLGHDEDTIATRLKLDVVTVQRSLLKYFKQKFSGSEEMVALRVNSMTLDRLEQVDLLIKEGLSATRAIIDGEGKEIGREPDLTTRTKMAHLLREWKQAVTPKTPLINQTLNQNNQQNNFNGGTKGLNMEGRLRAIREKNGLRNDEDDSSNVIDAEFEDEDLEGDENEEVTVGDDEDSTQGQ